MIVHSGLAGAILRGPCTVGKGSVNVESKSAVESMRNNCRGVAQPGSAPALGAGGLEFKSPRPDQNILRIFFDLLKARFTIRIWRLCPKYTSE